MKAKLLLLYSLHVTLEYKSASLKTIQFFFLLKLALLARFIYRFL